VGFRNEVLVCAAETLLSVVCSVCLT
jgi:hypothetical protein